MSDLQISLIAIGFVVIGGVVFFNWMQQRRYQRGTEDAFKHKYKDVLLEPDKSTSKEERIEPQFGKEMPKDLQVEPSVEAKKPTGIDRPDLEPLAATTGSTKPVKVYSNGVIDYVVSIQSDTPIATTTDLAEMLQRKFDFGKPVRWFGQRDVGEFWEEITHGTG